MKSITETVEIVFYTSEIFYVEFCLIFRWKRMESTLESLRIHNRQKVFVFTSLISKKIIINEAFVRKKNGKIDFREEKIILFFEKICFYACLWAWIALISKPVQQFIEIFIKLMIKKTPFIREHRCLLGKIADWTCFQTQQQYVHITTRH